MMLTYPATRQGKVTSTGIQITNHGHRETKRRRGKRTKNVRKIPSMTKRLICAIHNGSCTMNGSSRHITAHPGVNPNAIDAVSRNQAPTLASGSDGRFHATSRPTKSPLYV